MLQTVMRCASSLVAAAALFSGCSGQSSPGASTTPVTPAPAPAPPIVSVYPVFSNVVLLGDSLTQGSQNGGLEDAEQVHAYAPLLATQGGFPITQALVAPPGYNPVYQLQTTTFPVLYAREPGTSTGRENRTAQATDLAVPGAKAFDILNTTPHLDANGNAEDFTGLVLGYPAGNVGTQLQQAIAQHPSCVVLWIGVNDLLPGGPSGDLSEITPVATYSEELAEIIGTLQEQTTAKLVVANIPDLTLLSAFTTGQQLADEVAAYTNGDSALLLNEFGLTADALVKPSGLNVVISELPAIGAGAVAAPLPAADVLTTAQIATLRATIAAYNQVIAQQVQAAGGTLVDLYSYVNTLQSGLTVNGTTLTLGYLGGFYSIDGLHYTNTGYALIANRFIAAINAGLNTTMTAVDIDSVAAADPLFPPNITASASAEAAQTARLRRLLALRARGAAPR